MRPWVVIIDMYDEFNDWSNVAVAVEGIMGTGLTGKLRDLTVDVLHDIDTHAQSI